MAQTCSCNGFNGPVEINFGTTQCCDGDGSYYTTGADAGYENILCSGCNDCCGKAGMGGLLGGGSGGVGEYQQADTLMEETTSASTNKPLDKDPGIYWKGVSQPIVPLGGDILPRTAAQTGGPGIDKYETDFGFDGGAVKQNWVPLLVLGLSLVIGIGITEWAQNKYITK
jgi:hypothetical protein